MAESKSGSPYAVGASPGTRMRGSVKRFAPASRTSTWVFGSATNLLATTNPDMSPPLNDQIKGCDVYQQP
ncbi:hypothetical protein KXV73_002249, partial [Aspergillus fumigatus]